MAGRAAKRRKLSDEVLDHQNEVDEVASESGNELKMYDDAVPNHSKRDEITAGISNSSNNTGVRYIVPLMDPRAVMNQVFTNELIVSKIVEYLPVRDLIKFRTLCTVWNVEAVKKIKWSHKMLRFEVHKGLNHRDDNKNIKVIPGPRMDAFVNTVLESPEKVFTRFAFLGSQLSNTTIVRFLENYGSLIQELEIEWDKGDLSLISSFRELIFFAVPNLRILRLKSVPASWSSAVIFPSWIHTKLVSLKVIDLKVPVMNSDNFRSSYKLLHSLLEIAPNVESVPRLQLGGSTDVQSGVIDTFINLNKQKVLKGIEFVTFNSTVYESIAHLSAKDVCIETMYFYMRNLPASLNLARQTEIIEAIEKIIEDQKDNLKFLRLEITAPERPFINLPVLPKLTGLKVVRGSNCQVVPTDISYARNVPKLKELCIVGGRKGFGSKLSSVLPLVDIFHPNTSVEKLTLVGCIESVYAIRRAASIFPNIKSLSLSKVMEPVYAALWSSWPNLEECNIKYVHNVPNVDSVFTGISVKTCNAIQRDLNSYERASIWYSNSVGFYPNIAPTITRWKKLRKLQINYTNQVNRPKDLESNRYISDITGCMAFSKMPALQELVIGYCKISSYCTQMLESKMNIVRISRACAEFPPYEEDDVESDE